MKKFLLIAFALLCAGCTSSNNQVSCDDNYIITEINLPENTKFVSISYDDVHRYTYSYRQRHENEPVEEYVVKTSKSSREIKVKEH